MIGPRLVDRPLVIYGLGKLGRLALEIFHELKIPIVGVVDKTCAFRHKHPVDAMLAVCVATEPYSSVIKPLVDTRWTDIVPVWDILEAYPETGIRNGWFAGPMSSEDRVGVSVVSLGLTDKISRTHYYAFVDWRKYHDELDYVPEPREVLPSTLADIRARQRVITFADAPMETVSIHAEGCELKTLEVNMPLFQKYRPKIEVACYHSRDGLYLIETYLMDNLSDYLWRFRMSAYMGQGAYIYGTPEERII